MNNKKKFSIFITSACALSFIIQGTTYATQEKNIFISNVNPIVRQAVTLASVATETEQEDPNEIITIQVNDEVFYEALVTEYGGIATQNSLELTMTRGQINALTEFEYTGSNLKKIKDITGIENFKNLQILKLNKNEISDISKIVELTNLTHFEIKSNGLKVLPDLSKLNKLSILDISSNSISNLEGIANNFALTKLFASANFVTNIIPITSISTLEEINLSSNNITDIASIYRLSNLRKLDLSDNTSIREIEAITNLSNLNKLVLNQNNAITDLTKLVEKDKVTKVPKLINLTHLELQGVNNSFSKISISNLKVLTNLEFLNVNSNGYTKNGLSGIVELINLKTLYANNNDIEDLSYLVDLDSDGNVEVVSKIADLRMAGNEIEEVDTLGYMADTIKYLDLSENHIHNINSIENLTKLEPKYLFLQNQTGNFNIKKKTNTNVEQKIILDSIFQYCKDPNKKIYAENANFAVTGAATLNTDTYIIPNVGTGKYDEEPGNYNIVFPENIEAGSVGTVTISGGRASGSEFTFTITTSTGSKVYDSIVFEDYYLTDRVATELLRKEKKLVGWVPYILNIEYKEIATIDELILTGDEGRRVKSIKGLESFINLKYIDLAVNSISNDNSVSKINLLKDLPQIQTLILSDNDLQSADVITNYKNITKIDLSNNEISDLTPFKMWLEMLISNRNAESKLVEINVSGNSITDLTPIQGITTVTKLYIGKNNIKDIKPIATLTELTTLDISSNKIEDISILENLTNLKTLNLSSNKIKDISSIAKLNLYDLDISNNRILDLEDIKNMASLTNILANTNRITTIEPIKDFIVNNLELNYQKLHYALEEINENIVTVELPKLFTETKEENGLIYTEEDFVCNNCSLTEDGKVQINIEELGNKIATVKIKNGNANGSQLAIARALKPVLTYSTEEKTKENVTVTISFEGRQASIVNNDENTTYTFTKNGEFTFEFEDDYGFVGTATAKVDWIDKEGPKAEVIYSPKEITKEDVIVTITANEECNPIEGWTLLEDKKVLTKTYAKNTNEKIVLEDKLGNQSQIDVVITNIDKTAPKIEGVEEGKTYAQRVKPVIIEENLDTIELTKDGEKVEDYKKDDAITENGQYKFTLTDKAGNKTEVNFAVEIESQSDTLEVKLKKDSTYQIKEDERALYIENIKPNTTIESIKSNIETNGEIKIYKGETEVTDKETNIATEMIIKVFLNKDTKEYKIVVTGDLNGDGQMNDIDLLMLSRYKAKLYKNLSKEGLKASDIERNGTCADDMDLLKMARILVGLD
ncbi:MAG: leucine-rich repeat domain-containing protein [Clostridia bacterium]|nr:leucine-rich repeat domain-containing protein [Clostridia bacterium]